MKNKILVFFGFIVCSLCTHASESSNDFCGHSLNSSSDKLPVNSQRTCVTPLAIDRALTSQRSSSAPSSPRSTPLSPKPKKESPRGALSSLLKSISSPKKKNQESTHQYISDGEARYVALLHEKDDICASIEIASDTIRLYACKYKDEMNRLIATSAETREKGKTGIEVDGCLNELSKSIQQVGHLYAMLVEANTKILGTEEAPVNATKQE